MKKAVMLLLLILTGLSTSAVAATITATSSGNWNTNAVWSCGCQPTNADNVVIPSGKTITIPPLTGINLTGGPVITITVSGTLTVNGSLSIDSSDMIVINSGGQINSAIIWPLAAAVNSGGTTFWVNNVSSINGLAYMTNGTLPITLTSFAYTVSDSQIELQWTSASEENFDYYLLERSRDGVNFTDIGKVTGAGNSNTTLHYAFEDKSPLPGKSYYRLKAIDLDGSEESFKIITAEFTAPPHEALVFPNPAVDKKFTLQINFTPTDSDKLIIHSDDGKVIVATGLSATETQVNLPENSAGNYFIEIVTSSEKLSQHVIVP